MSRNQDNSEREGEGHPWRNGAISVAVVGAIIAVMFYSAHFPARQESVVQPWSAGAARSAEVHDCLRVKRVEIVDEAGRIVGVLQGVDHNKDAFGMLELIGHGTRAGRFVRVDPQRVIIVGDGGFTEVLATGAEWSATMPSGEDDVKVRIAADPNGGSVHVKSSASTASSGCSQRTSVKNE
jgi:hypothetical protein